MKINNFARKAYTAYTAFGLTPEGACGLMGNQYPESAGFLANRLEFLCVKRYKEKGKTYTDATYTQAVDNGKISRAEFLSPMGKHYGYGLAQWTTSKRKAGLYDRAKKQGVSIADEDLQIEYVLWELEHRFPKVLQKLKTTKSVQEASDYVLQYYEQPNGWQSMKKTRASYGQTYYKELAGKEKTVTNVVLAGHGSGTPSTKGMNAYCTTRQAKGRGLVEVLREDLTDKQRQQMHDLYKTILGRNIYSQSLRLYCYTKYNGKYYSDCSSSICKTAEKVGVPNIGTLNTAGMHKNWKKVTDVVIKNGIIQNPEVLKVGDALMFKGSDSSRPLGIGHTEMVYEINGKTAASATPAATSSKKDIVKAGQMHANNFTGAGLVVDGVRGTLTKKAGIMAVQTALNLDFKAGLKVDGEWGPKSDAALKKRSVRLGSTRYLVTAVEILLMLKGYNPNGVECPGQFGSGCAAATGNYQTDHSLKADKIAGYNTIKSLIK
ncbi:hypothetical protein DWX98_01375 [Blautia sp. AF22-5LB]|nr:hypothetical protein DWX98_01375 [Blautia sp. AF22-5LB]